MANHTVDCGVCGNDLRGLSGGHAVGCPGENATPAEIAAFEARHLAEDMYPDDGAKPAYSLDDLAEADGPLIQMADVPPRSSPVIDAEWELYYAARDFMQEDRKLGNPRYYIKRDALVAAAAKVEQAVADRDPTVSDQCHPSHKTRVSDASSFDEICVRCGRTDTIGGWGRLKYACPTTDGSEKWA